MMIPLTGITMQFCLIYYLSLITLFITIQLYLIPDLKHFFLWAPCHVLVVMFRCNTNPGLPEADGVTEAAGSKHTDPPQQVHSHHSATEEMEITPSAATWVDVEMITVSEGRQRRTDTV